MELFDTHCHIQEELANFHAANDARWAGGGQMDPDEQITDATARGVTRLLCVGTTVSSSRKAIDFVATRPGCWATIGLHPHDANGGQKELDALMALLDPDPAPPSPSFIRDPAKPLRKVVLPTPPYGSGESLMKEGDGGAADASSDVQIGRPDKIVAIGECGLDYFYKNSSKTDQIKSLRFQIELALKHNLPLVFHVREALGDFWPVFDSYKGVRGVLHSFTDTQANLQKAIERGMYIGVNGIVTFTKNDDQLAMYKAIPDDYLVLETDAPFLTPAPHRGTVNVPGNVRLVAEFLARLRGDEPHRLAKTTTTNARKLFGV